MERIYVAFAASVVRGMLLVAGGWLVSRGLVEDGLMKEVAAGLALIFVTQAWSFWRIHQQDIYQRWLVLLGLREPTPLSLMAQDEQATQVERAAKSRTKEGWIP